MKAVNITKIIAIFFLLLTISCGDLPKEGDGTEKVEVKVELKYDNTTKRLTAIYFFEE